MLHQAPLKAFYSKRGSGAQGKADAELGRREAQSGVWESFAMEAP